MIPNTQKLEGGAPFNMAIATLMRIDGILKQIELVSANSSMSSDEGTSLGVAQHVKYKIVRQLYIQSVPLFNPHKKDEQKKEIQELFNNIKLIYNKHIDKSHNNSPYYSEGFSPEVEYQLDEITIKIQEILQDEQYFMPPKHDPRYSWKQ